MGEAGLGKSTAVSVEVKRLVDEITDPDCRNLSIDLAAVSDELGLRRRLFERHGFREWFVGEARLCLFLDSLDECAFSYPILLQVLLEEFRKGPAENLMLRVVSRASAWPQFLEGGITELYDAPPSVYLLAPLLRRDVESAARAPR